MLGDRWAFGSLVGPETEVFLVTLLGVVPSVFLPPLHQGLDAPQRGLLGWFGIKGADSLYLLYAMNQGLPPSAAVWSSNLIPSVVALSILVQGLSVQPLLARYQGWRKPTP